MTKAGDYWREQQKGWAIPEEIIAQAPESPWIHPAVVFQIPDVIAPSPSHDCANEVNPQSLLDIGCGGGVAAYGSSAPHVIGLDHQQEMLDMFKVNADKYQKTYETILGNWPEVSEKTPKADVVVAHHVAFNVQNIEEFILTMSQHAHKRCILEVPKFHPQTNVKGLWKHFWNIDRPSTPTADDLMPIFAELGIKAHIKHWVGETRGLSNFDEDVKIVRIRLCLPQSREEEVKQYLLQHPPSKTRELATIWWDIQ